MPDDPRKGPIRDYFRAKNILIFGVGVSMLGLAFIPLNIPFEHLLWVGWKSAVFVICVLGMLALFGQLILQTREDRERDWRERERDKKMQEMYEVVMAKPPVPLIAASEATYKLASAKPTIMMVSYQYIWLKPDANYVWRADHTGQKALLFNFINNTDLNGKGVDAFAVRAQITFEYDTGVPGPSFSPVGWLDEELSFVDIPLGIEKKLVIGTGFGPQSGWYGYKYNRINSSWPKGINPMDSNPIPDHGKMRVRLFSSINGQSELIWVACFSWNIDFNPNHPWFDQIRCEEMKALRDAGQ